MFILKKSIHILIVSLVWLNMSVAQDWHMDLTSAMAMAATENKPIILVFQGSDWCAPCIKLDQEIWSTESFRTYAKSHFIMLLADFPRKKANALSQEQIKKNATLADKYNANGIFPLVVVLDKNGFILGKTGYKKMTPEAYIQELNSFIH